MVKPEDKKFILSIAQEIAQHVLPDGDNSSKALADLESDDSALGAILRTFINEQPAVVNGQIATYFERNGRHPKMLDALTGVNPAIRSSDPVW